MGDRSTRRPRRTTAVLLWGWVAVVTGTIAGVVIVNGGNAPRTDSVDVAVVVFWLLTPLYALLGALIALKRPGNRIGTLFLLVSAGLCVEAAFDSYLPAAKPDPAGVIDVVATQWSNIGFWVVIVLPIVLLLHVFPDGRFLGPRFTWARWSALLTVSTVVIAVVLSGELSPAYTGADWVLDNPIGVAGVDGLEFPSAAVAFGVGIWSLVIGGVISMVKRFRRSTARVRAQIKWVAYALGVFAASAILGLAVLGDYSIALVAVSALFVPISVTLAITRYRLFDIDRIISRTVTYGIVAVVLGSVFGLMTLIPTVVVGAAEGGESLPSWFVAITTLLVFALFSPMRRRVQLAVDRRFNRSRFDAQQVVEGLGVEIQDTVDVSSISSGLVDAANEILQPVSVGMWLREGET